MIIMVHMGWILSSGTGLSQVSSVDTSQNTNWMSWCGLENEMFCDQGGKPGHGFLLLSLSLSVYIRVPQLATLLLAVTFPPLPTPAVNRRKAREWQQEYLNTWTVCAPVCVCVHAYPLLWVCIVQRKQVIKTSCIVRPADSCLLSIVRLILC